MKNVKPGKGVSIPKYGLAPMLLLEWIADNKGIQIELSNDYENDAFILYVIKGNEYILEKETECLAYIQANM